jgi:hypothetical protein
MTRAAIVLVTALLGGCAARTTVSPLASASGPDACFRIDTLPPSLSAYADRILLEASDGEALYTLASGLKPLSSGRSFSYVIAPELQTSRVDSLELMRRATRALSCGEIGAFVHMFTAVQTRSDSTQTRVGEVVVFHRAAVAATIARNHEFFAALGITQSADVREVLSAVENAPRAARWRGYGLLFGYPDHAVDFFVRAGIAGDSLRVVVPRDFRRIETFRKYPAERGQLPTLSSFVYAVPKDAPETDADRALRRSAAPVYNRYVREREQRVRADSTGAAALWRRWSAPPLR